MKSQQSHGSLTCLPERRNSTATGRNQPAFSRRSSLVDCYGRKRRRSLVELPVTAMSWDDRQRLSLTYLDATRQWSLAECSTLHSRSEEIDTSSLSYEVSRGNEQYRGPYQPVPHTDRQEEHNNIMFISQTRNQWRPVILSQLMAFLFSCMTVCSIYLKETHNMPTILNSGHYPLLSMVFSLRLFCRNHEVKLLTIVKYRGWWYMLIALADVETNYLLGTSLQLKTFTTMQLLSCAALPATMILSLLILRVRYKAVHVVGLVLGYIAIACLAWTNILDGSLFIEGKDQLQDDIIYLFGITLFVGVTIVEEWAVKAYHPVEFLVMTGLFGSIISCVQIGIFERSQLMELCWSSWNELLLIIGYSLVQSIFTAMLSFVVHDAGATLLHLSLITSHFYLNLIKSVLLQQTQFHVLYTGHLIAALFGILLFASKQVPVTIQQSCTSSSVPIPSLETSDIKDSHTPTESTPLPIRYTPSNKRDIAGKV